MRANKPQNAKTHLQNALPELPCVALPQRAIRTSATFVRMHMLHEEAEAKGLVAHNHLPTLLTYHNM